MPEPPGDPATEAVSPIVGAILMVVITVVLAAVLVFIVADLRQPSEPGVVVQFTINQGGSLLTVASAQTVLDLSNVEVRLSTAGHAAYNAPAGLGSAALPADTFVRLTSTPGTQLQAGDTLRFCADGGAPQGATLQIRSIQPTGLFYQNAFSHLPTCT